MTPKPDDAKPASLAERIEALVVRDTASARERAAIAGELREIAHRERQSATALWAKEDQALDELGADHVRTRTLGNAAGEWEYRADRLARKEGK